MIDFDILVVGGGMVGTCAAALLAEEPAFADAKIALLEPHAPTVAPDDHTIDLRVSVVSRASERILRHAQAWDRLPSQHCAAYEAMTVWDASSKHDSASGLHFTAAETGEPNLGYIIENRRLQWALFETPALRRRVTVLGGSLQGLEFGDPARVTLADGRTIRARLVIGADGAQSKSRELSGIQTAGWSYEQAALVAHVQPMLPHRRTAWQRFTADGPVAFLPLADGRCSIVWTNPTQRADALVNMSETEFARELGVASDHVLGELTVTTPRVRFPLQLAHAREYTKPRFALIGDAAHAVHPLAGQGVNLGFMDCAALVETLAAARRAGSSLDALGEARVLRRYERWRKSENLFALGLIDGLNKLFSNDSSTLGFARRLGFAAIERTPLAKRFFILRALGLAGERPAMARSLRS
ncbi:MAG TPA: UbiH/UbiF/VisC/COQ6 family ubiquinone biosynthesis hydroxylase [Steroidobacteraceae bacterium]|nr:UbiH/UbiF/VisC/COQ6 family ubiquinone biosynthesis hydroxylase [Steroidobacteraceae bacterium]